VAGSSGFTEEHRTLITQFLPAMSSEHWDTEEGDEDGDGDNAACSDEEINVVEVQADEKPATPSSSSDLSATNSSDAVKRNRKQRRRSLKNSQGEELQFTCDIPREVEYYPSMLENLRDLGWRYRALPGSLHRWCS
jgi:hypothetical protein